MTISVRARRWWCLPPTRVPSVQCKQEMENQIGSAHIYQGRDLASYWKPTRVFPLADRRCVVIVLWPSTSSFSSNKKKMILLTQSSWTFGQLGYVWLNSSFSSSSSSKCRHCQSQSLHLDSWIFGHLWPGWQKLRGSTGGPRRKVWTRTKILSPNIRYFVAN